MLLSLELTVVQYDMQKLKTTQNGLLFRSKFGSGTGFNERRRLPTHCWKWPWPWPPLHLIPGCLSCHASRALVQVIRVIVRESHSRGSNDEARSHAAVASMLVAGLSDASTQNLFIVWSMVILVKSCPGRSRSLSWQCVGKVIRDDGSVELASLAHYETVSVKYRRNSVTGRLSVTRGRG